MAQHTAAKIWSGISILFSGAFYNPKPFYTELASVAITINSLTVTDDDYKV